MCPKIKIILLGSIFIIYSLIAQAKPNTEIKVLEKPNTGKFSNLKGKIKGKEQELGVIACIYLGRWWSKSLKDGKPFPIDKNGKWEIDITNRRYDEYATKVGVFLVPKDFVLPPLEGVKKLPSFLKQKAIDYQIWDRKPHPDFKMLQFSGYNWAVKGLNGSIKLGPGPNYFSRKKKDVWIDPLGHLHMKISKRQNKYFCTEVQSIKSFGYGTYRFRINTRLDYLDPNIVLGLFTWDPFETLTNNYNREIDIEFSRWSDDNTDINAQYVVQPWEKFQNIDRFSIDQSNKPLATEHEWVWTPESITFRSFYGSSQLIKEWTYRGKDLPDPNDVRVTINFWLMRGKYPMNGQEAEAIIESFSFEPL